MFHIDEKYSGREKRKTIGYYKGKEKERQKLRKKLHPVSRDIDNYFHSALHEKAWWPNGLFTRKKYYYYADPGLGCFYEKNNVEQLKDLRELQSATKRDKLKNFIEYSYIEDNQYAITIEYCSNCEEHKTHTFHRAEIYKNYAISLQKCISLRFPFIKVILKPIDTDILKGKLPKLDPKQNNSETKYINDKFKECRIGAFEVQICFKKSGEDLKVALLHSKLQSKQFPEIVKVLDKIVSYLPTFRGKIITYEKEEDMNENRKENNNDDIYKKELMEGLQINIYLLNNEKITSIANDAWNDIQTQQDPHKREIMIKKLKIQKKENMFKNDSTINNYIYKSRPRTSINGYQVYHKSQSVKNTLRPNTSKTFLLGKNNYNYNVNDSSSILSSSVLYNSPMKNYVLDKNKAKSLKGKLILSKYTNSEGTIEIGPLPYDSYFIEVQESKQYRSVGLTLTFNTLNIKNNNYIKKYIGLFTQENSFIQLHVYELNKDNNGAEEPIHLGKAKVIIKKVSNLNSEENDDNYENNVNSDNDENLEKKIKINEKTNSPGIFEHTVPPGRYLLEVEKTNYETIRKFIDLEKGANTINVEMSIERYCNLLISVFNYEKFQEESYVPIHNVDVIIYQNSNDILEETITDHKGEVCYKVNKGEDFLTVVVNKLGYYPVQRVFMRNKEAPINENGEYEEKLIFFLVKENFILENNCILCVTYSSFSEVNFDPNAIQISDNIKNRLILSCYDGQKENGIISTFIKYQTREEMNQRNNMTNNMNKISEEQDNNILQENEEQQVNNNENNEQMNNNEQINNNDINNVEMNNNEINNNEINNNENVEENTTTNRTEDDNGETENYDNIISFSYIIQQEALKNTNYQDKGFTMNGLERYNCQTIIYMPKNMFYITAPSYSREGYCLWNLGWIDVKNQLFYQTNTLTESLDERILHFSSFLEFLQTLIDNKIYSKLFEFFGFDKALLLNNDRYITDINFMQCLKELSFSKDNDDIISFITSLFKSNNKMISFSLVKKKISSNLKNFSDEAIGARTLGDNNKNDESLTVNNDNNNNNNNINEYEEEKENGE